MIVLLYIKGRNGLSNITKIKIRGIISSILALLLLIIVGTGIYLMLVEQGRIKTIIESYRMIHVFAAFGMTILVIIHLTINFKMYLNELKNLKG